MKNLLFPAVAALFASTAAHAALAIDVFDNGASIGTAVSTTSNADLSITTDPAFDIITVDATGAPLHSPDASLSSVTLASEIGVLQWSSYFDGGRVPDRVSSG
jgi:hypothetical protein